MRRVPVHMLRWLGGLVALVVATATSGVAERFGGLVVVQAPWQTPYRLDGIVIVVAGSLVAGAIYAAFGLNTPRARTLPVALILLSLAMLLVDELLQRRLGVPRLDLATLAEPRTAHLPTLITKSGLVFADRAAGSGWAGGRFGGR